MTENKDDPAVRWIFECHEDHYQLAGEDDAPTAPPAASADGPQTADEVWLFARHAGPIHHPVAIATGRQVSMLPDSVPHEVSWAAFTKSVVIGPAEPVQDLLPGLVRHRVISIYGKSPAQIRVDPHA